MKTIQTHIAKKPTEKIRFQEYGVGIFDLIPTKSGLKKAVKKGLILINGEKATTAQFINGGEKIELLEEKSVSKKPFIKHLDVLFEDEDLAIIIKPNGILTSGNAFATIANCLEMNLKDSSRNDAVTPFPVHRLDYATSGLLLIGKTASCRRILHEMFEQNQITKTYHAVCVGKMRCSEGCIEEDLDGKPSVTNYKVLKSVISERFEALNLVELYPKTGRTHQLRRHLLLIGNPIMGDKKYFVQNKQHKGYGLYLHATKLELSHPISHKKLLVESDLPKKMLRIFKNSNKV